MDDESKLRFLLDLAESFDIEVRRGPTRGDGWDSGGGSLVRLRGKEILFLDSDAPRAAQIAAVAAVLAQRDQVEQIFLPPEIRQTIDRARDLR